MYQNEETGLWVRNKCDEGVIRQMKDYNSLLAADIQGARILDLGGFIGTFAWWAEKNLDPKYVVSVEPDPGNIELFHKNIGPKTKLIEAAVTMKTGDTLPLYLGKTYRSCNSLEAFRGREKVDVMTIAFQDLFTHHEFDVIKCDIEGGEFGLDWTIVPDSIKFIVMEIHQQRPQWIEQMKVIDQQILDLGFEHVRKPKHVQTFHKVDIGAWRRK
jgi:FkbM family methyltransferase